MPMSVCACTCVHAAGGETETERCQEVKPGHGPQSAVTLGAFVESVPSAELGAGQSRPPPAVTLLFVLSLLPPILPPSKH